MRILVINNYYTHQGTEKLNKKFICSLKNIEYGYNNNEDDYKCRSYTNYASVTQTLRIRMFKTNGVISRSITNNAGNCTDLETTFTIIRMP